MTYFIIGSDQKEYGPATAELIGEWIAQRRVDGQTRARPEGGTGWQPLSAFAEFALPLARVAPVPQPLSAHPAGGPRTNPMAMAGLVMGILSVGCCCCYGFPFNLLGITFSILGLVQIQRHPEVERGKELAIAGLVLSLLGVLSAFFLHWLGFLSKLSSGANIFETW